MPAPPGPCGDSVANNSSWSTLRPLTFAKRGIQAVFLVILCMATRPLVYAHHSGCTLYGFIPAAGTSTNTISSAVRRGATAQWGPSTLVFLAGQYNDGPRLYVAAISLEERALRTPTPSTSDGFDWLSVVEAMQSPAWDPISHALLTIQMFTRPVVEWADAHDAAFRTGRSLPTNVVSLFQQAAEAPPAWKALQRSILADDALISLLESSAGQHLLDGWLDAIRPLPIDALPSNLLLSLSDFEDSRLTEYPLPEVFSPYTTRRLPLHPVQPAPRATPIPCPRPRHLFTQEGYERLTNWLSAQRADLQETRRQLDAGVHPDEVQRPNRPLPLAIGQSEMPPWARDLVWDCRGTCCVPLDVRAPISSNLSLSFLSDELFHYPDQELYSHLLDGVSLEADVELQTVLVPHLTSLPRGFASVAKELRRLQKSSVVRLSLGAPVRPLLPEWARGRRSKVGARSLQALDRGWGSTETHLRCVGAKSSLHQLRLALPVHS